METDDDANDRPATVDREERVRELERLMWQQEELWQEERRLLLRQQEERHRTEGDELLRQQEELWRVEWEEFLRQQEEVGRAELEELRRQQEELGRTERSLANGTYYASINDIWEVDWRQYLREHFLILKRQSCPNLPEYLRTVQMGTAEQDAEVAVRSSGSSASQSLVFPTDIFGNPPFGDELAHLMPVSTHHACLWANLVCLVLGLDPWMVDWLTMQRFIHGINDGSERMNLTGLKHSVSNQIRVLSQKYAFDLEPCFLIVPILTLDEAKGWNGEGYHAFVLAGAPSEQVSAAFVYNMIGATESLDVEDPSSNEYSVNLEKARELLVQVLLGMAYSLNTLPFPPASEFPEDQGGLAPRSLEKLAELRQSLPVGNHHENHVPVPRLYVGGGSKPVRKIKFSAQGRAGQHPAPDPLLLTMKSATNWAWRHDIKLMATGECEDEDHEAV